VPLTSQEQDVVLNAAVCQHERPVGSASCVPLTTQEQDVVLNVAVCQHERPVGAVGVAVIVTLVDVDAASHSPDAAIVYVTV